jgi:dTDP-4-dehydrorhamnose reductase
LTSKQKPGVIVTGAGGQLGNELQLLAKDNPSFDFHFYSREEISVTDREGWRAAFEKIKPRWLINGGAYTAVDKAESEKVLAFQINAEAVGDLAELCRLFNTRLLHYSTDYVFDGASIVPYKEDDPVNPQSVYGASKLEGEKLALKNNPDTIIFRTSWVYSPFGKNFIRTMLRLFSERDSVQVVKDQVGSPTYAFDLAEMTLKVMEIVTKNNKGWKPGIYHFANSGIVSWYELALAVREIVDSPVRITPITTADYPTPAKRPAYSVLDTAKIQQSFDIKIKDWRQRLEHCLGRIQ